MDKRDYFSDSFIIKFIPLIVTLIIDILLIFLINKDLFIAIPVTIVGGAISWEKIAIALEMKRNKKLIERMGLF